MSETTRIEALETEVQALRRERRKRAIDEQIGIGAAHLSDDAKRHLRAELMSGITERDGYFVDGRGRGLAQVVAEAGKDPFWSTGGSSSQPKAAANVAPSGKARVFEGDAVAYRANIDGIAKGVIETLPVGGKVVDGVRIIHRLDTAAAADYAKNISDGTAVVVDA